MQVIQEFDFPTDLSFSQALQPLLIVYIIIVAIIWINGYRFIPKPEDLIDVEEEITGIKRANYRAKWAGGIGFFILICMGLSWTQNFYRLELFDDDSVNVWIDPSTPPIRLSKDDIESIHVGTWKGCRLRIHLKNGKKYTSTSVGNNYVVSEQCDRARKVLPVYVQNANRIF